MLFFLWNTPKPLGRRSQSSAPALPRHQRWAVQGAGLCWLCPAPLTTPKAPPRLLPLLERIVLAPATFGFGVWTLSSPLLGTRRVSRVVCSPPPFRLGIAFSTDAGGSLGDPRVPARSHRLFGGVGGEPPGLAAHLAPWGTCCSSVMSTEFQAHSGSPAPIWL